MDNSTLHDKRLPNESPAYRQARNALLEEERKLRRQTEAVAALRRTLPLGGEVPEDYRFTAESGPMPLSALFGGKPTLVLYSFMFGPKDKRPCPVCTSFLDSLDGAAPHILQHAAMTIVAKSPIERILAFAQERGWRNLRMVSSAGTTYNRDYFAETPSGDQMPLMNVFVRRDGKLHHSWQSELFHMPSEPGQDPRHIDTMWPLWNVLDLAPEGRGTGWMPTLDYSS